MNRLGNLKSIKPLRKKRSKRSFRTAVSNEAQGILILPFYLGEKAVEIFDYKAKLIAKIGQSHDGIVTSIRSLIFSTNGKYALTNPRVGDRNNGIYRTGLFMRQNDGSYSQVKEFNFQEGTRDYQFLDDSILIGIDQNSKKYFIYNLNERKEILKDVRIIGHKYSSEHGDFLLNTGLSQWELHKSSNAKHTSLIHDFGLNIDLIKFIPATQFLFLEKDGKIRVSNRKW